MEWTRGAFWNTARAEDLRLHVCRAPSSGVPISRRHEEVLAVSLADGRSEDFGQTCD